MNAIIASTSTIHGSEYLAYLQPALKEHFNNIKELIFIPFARPGGISHDTYTQKAQEGLAALNIKVKGIHEFKNYTEAITQAEAIFTGGGNTFVLLNQLYQHKLIAPLQNAILNQKIPYLGTSAGSNICGKNIKTTNDMPIVYPPSYDSLGILPFNINPHYLDPNPNSTHKGETRETRIKEFHAYNSTPVIGLREGSWLKATEKDIVLEGDLKARVFKQGETPYEVVPNTSFKNLK